MASITNVMFMLIYKLMKKLVIILSMCLVSGNWCQAKHLHTEKEYQTYWCNKRGGQMEVALPNKSRIDCLLPDMAVEVDFANKFHECIGQALEYSKWTHKTPACVLIVEKDTDWRYVRRLRNTVYNKKNVAHFKTFTVKPESLSAF